MQTALENVSNFLHINPGFIRSVLFTVIVISVLWLVRRVLLKYVSTQVEDPNALYKWRKNSFYIVLVLALLILSRAWFEGFESLATFLGLLTAGIAIALKDPLLDMAGWIYIITRQPFEVGDRIQIGEQKGDVIDQRIFKFTLVEIGNWVDADQSTGRVIHIPNHRIFLDAIANYTSGFRFIWHEIPVLITHESNWRKAKEILMLIAQKHSEKFTEDAQKELKKAANSFMIIYKVLTPTVYTSVNDSGIELTIRYVSDPRKRRGSEQAIWEDVLDAFRASEDIQFGYRTVRVFNNKDEGKSGAKKPQ